MVDVTSGVTSILCFFAATIFIIIIFLASSIRIVQENKRLSVYRLGRYVGEKGPGLVILIPIIDRGILKELGGAPNVPSQRITGIVGETRTTVFTDGKVFIANEEWDATSKTPISAGQRVRVVRTILEVETE